MKHEAVRQIEVDQVVPPEQWNVYKRTIQSIRESGIPFALGGALALGCYTGRFRNTKDIDLYIMPRDREATIQAMGRAGLSDYYDKLPYDRAWIYRAYEGNTIADAIWAMANHHADVDERWITAGPLVSVDGEVMRVLPAEELIWSKLYVMQRERCDWPDVLNLIHAAGDRIDWEHLQTRLGDDSPLLKGVLSVFSWICPQKAGALPRKMWKSMGLSLPEQPEGVEHQRADLLDTRPWLWPQGPETLRLGASEC